MTEDNWEPESVGRAAEARYGAADAWHTERAGLRADLATEAFHHLDAYLLTAVDRFAGRAGPFADLGGFAAGARRVRQGAAAARQLAGAGLGATETLLAAFLLPWCEPALGGDREVAVGRPVLERWAHALVLAALAPAPRPGQDPVAARRSYLHHLRTTSVEVRALALTGHWAAWSVARQEETGEETTRLGWPRLAPEFATVVDGLPEPVLALLGDPRPEPAWGPEPAAGPACSDPATALALAEQAAGPGRWTGRVEEYDVGFEVRLTPAATAAASPARTDSAPSPKPARRLGRFASWAETADHTPAPVEAVLVLVDRETGQAQLRADWQPFGGLGRYRRPHRVFPLALRVRAEGDGLAAPLAEIGEHVPHWTSSPLRPLVDSVARGYQRECRRGGDLTGWPEAVHGWRVGTATLRMLAAQRVESPEELLAGFLLGYAAESGQRWTEGPVPLPAPLETLLRLASPTADQLTDVDGHQRYLAALADQPAATRRVAVTVGLARAEHARTRYLAGSAARYRELAGLRALVSDPAGLDLADLAEQVDRWLAAHAWMDAGAAR